MVGSPGAWVVGGGGAEGGYFNLLCVSTSGFCPCSVSLLSSKLIFRKPGRRECFQLGEYQELTRPATVFLPPGEDRQSWAPCTVSALCISLAVGHSQEGFPEKKTWNEIRKRGPNYISNACLKMFQQNLSSQMTMRLSKLSTRLIFWWAKKTKMCL